jgi:hypothetical protein
VVSAIDLSEQLLLSCQARKPYRLSCSVAEAAVNEISANIHDDSDSRRANGHSYREPRQHLDVGADPSDQRSKRIAVHPSDDTRPAIRTPVLVVVRNARRWAPEDRRG